MSRENINIREIKQHLIMHRNELLAETEATKEERAAVEVDQQRIGRLSRMDSLRNQAMAREIERHRQIEIQHIDDALQRIEDGSYGYCTACDDEISSKRLKINPAVPLCINCADKAEKSP